MGYGVFRHRAVTALVLLVTLACLVGCASLPEPTPGQGLVVLPYYFQNDSPYPESIVKYELTFSDGSVETIVPADNLLILARTESFSLVSLKVGLNLQNWTGGEYASSVKVNFDVVPGSIVLSPSALIFGQGDLHDNNRSYNHSWRLAPLTPQQHQEISARLRADKNFHFWSLY